MDDLVFINKVDCHTYSNINITLTREMGFISLCLKYH